MITDLSTTTSFPSFETDDPNAYTLDSAYEAAQEGLWSTLMGSLLSWALFACLCIQVFFYFHRFPNDRPLIRATVALLFLIEFLATGFLTWTTYEIVIHRWGHDPFFAPATWGSMLFDSWVASTVHALYAWRIYKLITRRWLAIASITLIALLSLGQFACCTAAALFNGLQYHLSQDKQFVARRLFHGWLASATVADVFITTTIGLKLYSVRTGLPATDKTISKILYVTVPGGAITALVTLLILIIQRVWTGSLYYQILVLSLTKFYSNSVVLCLNLRTLHNSPNSRPSNVFQRQSDPTTNHSSGGRFDASIRLDVEKTTDASSTTDSQKQHHNHMPAPAPENDQLRIWM